jgi:hypothetical protein
MEIFQLWIERGISCEETVQADLEKETLKREGLVRMAEPYLFPWISFKAWQIGMCSHGRRPKRRD